MVRALLAGTKTQTRRAVKPQPMPDMGLIGLYAPGLTAVFGYETPDADHKVRLRFMPGDRLWVRESGHLLREAYDHNPSTREDMWRDAGFKHAADGAIVSAREYDPPITEWIDDCSMTSRPSIHMPRWASRLTLTVTDVRVERLQDITEADAIAEGIETKTVVAKLPGGTLEWELSAVPGEFGVMASPISAVDYYADLWNHINGASAWDANPWVAAYTFTVEKRNIDHIEVPSND
jgi:hypothetical protein